MAKQRRVFQVADKIRQVVASELNRMADPRFTLVTVTNVVVSPDLRNAKIYWVVSGGEERIEEVQDALKHAAPHFRRVLAKALQIRFVPEVRFYYDDTSDTIDEVERLLARVREESQERE